MTTRRTERPSAPQEPVSGETFVVAGPGHVLTTTTQSTTQPFVTASPREAWRYFLPLAKQVPAEGLTHLRKDPRYAVQNAARAVEILRPHFGLLASRCPHVAERDLVEIPTLALALLHAAKRVPAAAVSTGQIDAKIAEVSQPREDALSYLEIAARQNLVPADRVRKIREGTGKYDMATDCVAIPDVFEEFAEALTNKHPFPPEFLRVLDENGTWLVGALTPDGAVRGPSARSGESVIRDQFAKLLEDRYDQLRAAAAALLGYRAASEKIPALYAAVRGAIVATVDDSDAPADPSAPTG